MNAIYTIEDLIQLMDENPQWTEAMRARLLTRELIELPEKFTHLVANVDTLTDRVDTLADQMIKLTDRVDTLTVRVDTLTDRVDTLTDRVDDLADQMIKLTARVDSLTAELKSFAEATNRRFDALENRVQSIQDDVGILKGAHARSAGIREAVAIAREMGLYRTKNCTIDDLWALTDHADTSGIPTNELRSFRLADLIMEATDQDGETCYIAVEISFTANGRDTTRALRNAEFLTRFTGKQSRAAVVGLYRDDRIRDCIESGEVFWYQLDPQILEAE